MLQTPTMWIHVCNVPDPLIGEEDATMALTIRAESSMNMYIHKNVEMLKQNALN